MPRTRSPSTSKRSGPLCSPRPSSGSTGRPPSRSTCASRRTTRSSASASAANSSTRRRYARRGANIVATLVDNDLSAFKDKPRDGYLEAMRMVRQDEIKFVVVYMPPASSVSGASAST